jgi:DNA-binding beta-propeller fold protein YncE
MKLILPVATLVSAAILAGCAGMAPVAGKRELMIVANDEKQSWDNGTDPLAPKIIVNLPLANTIAGPPVNLAITPDETLAIVANSLNVLSENGVFKQVPDNRLYVIDLTTNPPKLIDTVLVGKQPSGLSINKAGNLALIANRADNSISVLRISGKKVELIDTVAMGDSVAHVRFTPDGKRAVAAKFPNHKIAFLDISGEKVTYNKLDVPSGVTSTL